MPPPPNPDESKTIKSIRLKGTNHQIRNPKLLLRETLTDGNVSQGSHSNASPGDQQSLRTTRELLDQLRASGLMSVRGAVERAAGPVGWGFVPDFDHGCSVVFVVSDDSFVFFSLGGRNSLFSAG